MTILNEILNVINNDYEYFVYIRDDNLDIGHHYDYTHGVCQGQVQAAECIRSKILKIINSASDEEVV